MPTRSTAADSPPAGRRRPAGAAAKSAAAAAPAKKAPVKRAAAKRTVLRPSLGGDLCDWIETYLCHGPGDIQGQPIELDDEYRAFLWRAYELYPRGHPLEGRRVYRRAFLSRPKGRAKSELAGEVACAEAFGPVRFDGWDSRGRPVGRPVRSPVVRCYATEETQAGNTYENVVVMLSEGAIADELDIDVGLQRTFVPGGGEIRISTSAAGSKDGGKETFAVFDETHLWISRPAKNLFATVTRNITKRKLADGWVLETSTMYGPGEGSVAEETHMAARTLGPDGGLLFDHRQAPADTDIEDDESLRAGLAYVYGPAAAWTNVDSIIRDEFRNPVKSEADNRRYWLNQPFKRSERFVDPIAHAELADRERVVEPGTAVVIGFDGSKNRDATALVAWTVEPRPHRFTIGLWLRPPDADDDYRHPVQEIDERVRWAFDTYDVKRMVCDPPGWRKQIEDWEEEFGEDIVIQFETFQRKKMADACDRFEVALKLAGFTHDADPVVDWMLHNCVAKPTPWGPVVAKASDPEKIDGGVAAIIGYWALEGLEEDRGAPNVYSLAEAVQELLAERAAERRPQPAAGPADPAAVGPVEADAAPAALPEPAEFSTVPAVKFHKF